MRASQRAPKSVRSSPVAPLSAAAHTHHTYRTAHHEPPARTQDKKTTQDEAPGPKYSLTDGFGVQARWPAATHDATAKPHSCYSPIAAAPPAAAPPAGRIELSQPTVGQV